VIAARADAPHIEVDRHAFAEMLVMSILNAGAAALAAMAVAMIATMPALAVKQNGPPPFCVARGGFDGPGSTPQDCRYDDYQSCLAAAAALRGNCVRNIDAR
jgi:hypothetical protein